MTLDDVAGCDPYRPWECRDCAHNYSAVAEAEAILRGAA